MTAEEKKLVEELLELAFDRGTDWAGDYNTSEEEDLKYQQIKRELGLND